MRDVDTILRKAGAAWRASQDTLAEPELPDFSSARTRDSWAIRPLIAISSLVVVLLVVAGGLFLRGVLLDRGPEVGGVQPPATAYVLREGDAVTGTADLIQGESGEVQLCEGGSRLMGPPTCGVVAVPVEGVDFETVPGAIFDGRWYANHVTVHGTWTGEMVVVDSVSSAPPDLGAPELPNPCADDEGDGTGLGTGAEETALRGLNDEVFGNPQRYGGEWRAASADGLGRIVVNVVGDPSAVESTLQGLYPFPLCVVAVAFSEADLEATLQAVGESTPEWRAAVDFPRNRVTVHVGYLTEQLKSRLEPYSDQVVVRQLLQPE